MQANQINQTNQTGQSGQYGQSINTDHSIKIKHSKPSKYGNTKSKTKYEPKAKNGTGHGHGHGTVSASGIGYGSASGSNLSNVKNDQTPICSFGQQCHFFRNNGCKSLHPCFFYKNGNCKFGDLCRSDHITPIAKLNEPSTVNTVRFETSTVLSPHAKPFNPTHPRVSYPMYTLDCPDSPEHKPTTCQFNKSVCSVLNLCCPTHSGPDIIDVGHDGAFYIVNGLQFSTWDSAWRQVNKVK